MTTTKTDHPYYAGIDPCAGIRAAGDRLAAALSRLLLQPPQPIPPVPEPTVGERGTELVIDLIERAKMDGWGISVYHLCGGYTAYLTTPTERGGVDRHWIRDRAPSDILARTRTVEMLAGIAEKAAAEHEERVRLAIEAAVASESEAIRELALRSGGGDTQLRAWALSQGSTLLRARIEDGYEWAGLARQEWADTHVDSALLTGGFVRVGDGRVGDGYDSGQGEDRYCPTLDEILDCRRGAEILAAAGVKTKAILRRITYERVEKDCTYHEANDPIERTELQVDATCPDGRVLQRFYRLPNCETVLARDADKRVTA